MISLPGLSTLIWWYITVTVVLYLSLRRQEWECCMFLWIFKSIYCILSKLFCQTSQNLPNWRLLVRYSLWPPFRLVAGSCKREELRLLLLNQGRYHLVSNTFLTASSFLMFSLEGETCMTGKLKIRHVFDIRLYSVTVPGHLLLKRSVLGHSFAIKQFATSNLLLI